jgi:hypothetical protein
VVSQDFHKSFSASVTIGGGHRAAVAVAALVGGSEADRHAGAAGRHRGAAAHRLGPLPAWNVGWIRDHLATGGQTDIDGYTVVVSAVSPVVALTIARSRP